jgi:hypothetical protein
VDAVEVSCLTSTHTSKLANHREPTQLLLLSNASDEVCKLKAQ